MNKATSALRFDSDLSRPDADLFGATTQSVERRHQIIGGQNIDIYEGEFWTAGQRKASSIHEVSYRACFKPQLPGYFIRRFTKEGDTVYDPFAGRGTTAIEAALWGRRVISNDANPLSKVLLKPRLSVPEISEIETRLKKIPIQDGSQADIDLSMFFHPKTEAEIVSFRNYLSSRAVNGLEDEIDEWIRMVATNRLTGHSSGFFSVYSFPPNQAVSQESQRRINEKRNQQPEYRDTRSIILKKSKQLQSTLSKDEIAKLRGAAKTARFLVGDARETAAIRSEEVQLTVTSPPFLNVVQYADDNWLRCWFNDLKIDEIAPRITMARTVEQWEGVMSAVFRELFRITKRGGFVAFEVGEVRNGQVKLDEHVVPIGCEVGFECSGLLINAQVFTKTSNIWGIRNNAKGTNTNRIVVFSKG